MRIDSFEWDEANIVKNISRHNTHPDEIEETFYNRYKLRKTKQGRYLLYGVTDNGRYLFVVFIFKKKNGKNIVRVISARDMTQKEKRYYRKK
ncbi:MAG TPA: BrnT family toxin [Thermodesulfobacteriota bacterium]|nr:BrnT family toxin [Thermodesulfobacteriota bacterium]